MFVTWFASTSICLHIVYSHFRSDGSAWHNPNLSFMSYEYTINAHIKDVLTNHVTKGIYNRRKALPFLSTALTAYFQAFQIIFQRFMTSKQPGPPEHLHLSVQKEIQPASGRALRDEIIHPLADKAIGSRFKTEIV